MSGQHVYIKIGSFVYLKSVAKPAYRFDPKIRCRCEPFAQPFNMYVYRSIISGVIDPPNLIDQLLACIDLSGSSSQLIQQFELFERQRERFCPSDHLIGLSIKRDVAELDRLRRADLVSFE